MYNTVLRPAYDCVKPGCEKWRWVDVAKAKGEVACNFCGTGFLPEAIRLWPPLPEGGKAKGKGPPGKGKGYATTYSAAVRAPPPSAAAAAAQPTGGAQTAGSASSALPDTFALSNKRCFNSSSGTTNESIRVTLVPFPSKKESNATA